MAYEQMAYIYDQFMKEAPYDEWLHFTKEMFKQSGKNIQHVVDLGCGTGQITKRLAKAGYHMIGVDYSTDMLTYAQQHANYDNLQVQWIHQDLRELNGLTELDAAVSYCDVMNYITTEEELMAVFNRVFDSLKNRGIFIFDVHSMNHVEKDLKHQTFADVREDMSYIWFCSGEEQGEMYHDLTFFTKENEMYERFDEYHYQRTFPIEAYQRLLQMAGFENTKVYSDFSLNEGEIHNEAERIFFVTHKNESAR